MKNRRLYLVLLLAIVIVAILLYRHSTLYGQNSMVNSYQHNEGTIFGTLYHAKIGRAHV